MKRISTWCSILLVIIILSACTTETTTTSTTKKDLQKASQINVKLGIKYLQQGDVPLAKQKLLLAEQQASSAEVYRAFAYYYEKTGSMQQADNYYQKAINKAPADGAGHNNYGVFLCRQKHYQQAEQQFLAAIHNPHYINTANAYENAGLCALLIPNNTKAIAYFQEALQQNPNMPTSLQQLVHLSYVQQQYQQANLYLQRYINVGQVSANTLWLGVQIALKLNDKTAMQTYGTLLKKRFPGSAQFAQYQQLIQASANDR